MRKLRTMLAAAACLALVPFPLHAGESTTPAPAPAHQAEARPNIIVWMLDDVGFGQIGAFGGLIETPNIDRVAARGLRYTNYHTAPICSASRAALLTGRNPHSVHVGGFAGIELPHQGYDGKVPAEDATVAANLQAAGYATFALGKWDHLPNAEMGPAGPFTRWPTNQGFDRFYGFMGADTDNFAPDLLRGKTMVPLPDDPDYLLNDDLAEEAIAMIGGLTGTEAPPPFFLYFATGTAHAPHHAPRRWIEHYRGRFDMGWDRMREMVLKRQIRQGIMPAGTKLAPRPEGMPAWDSLSADQKKLYARQMEVFAAALSAADEQFGRIVDRLENSGQLDNTIVLVTSDNGASAEGAHNGTSNELYFANGKLPSVEENMRFYDAWGGPQTLPHYAFGWAVAGNTPFRYYKQTSFEGGIHVPMVISWPRGIAAHGEVRGQFAYVADIAPTLMDLAGVSPAPVLGNVTQSAMEGRSFRYSLGNAKAPARTKAQYFELYGNKGLWSDGWSIVTSHRLKSWDLTAETSIDEPWELYNLKADPGQAHDLAASHPQRVADMAAMFDAQARRFNVLPFVNMGESWAYIAQNKKAEYARRNGAWHFPGPVSGVSEAIAPPLQALPFRMTANLDLPTGAETGPIFSIGGHLGGMALYLDRGVLSFMLRDYDGKAVTVAAQQKLPAGANSITLDFARDPARPLTAQDIAVTLAANGGTLRSASVEYAMPARFSASDGFSIGHDYGSRVSNAYAIGAAFPGSIGPVTFQFRQSARDKDAPAASP